MTNKEIFITTVEELFEVHPEVPSAAIEYFNTLKTSQEKEKPPFTENGAKVLKWMQENHPSFNNIFKAKDIADGLFIPSSRTASGALRKLITDGYASKIAGNPVCYSLTDLGKTVEVIAPVKDEEEDT